MFSPRESGALSSLETASTNAHRYCAGQNYVDSQYSSFIVSKQAFLFIYQYSR